MSPVKAAARANGIAVQQPPSLRATEAQEALSAVHADAWVVAAYGLILPAPLLAAPRYGCLNVHASLLPRWRGAAPIQRAIMAGDVTTGVSIMRMDEGLDTGPVYLQRTVPIGPQDTAGSLHDRLAELGADAMCEVLDRLPGGLEPEPQLQDGVVYAHKLMRDDARIDWARPALQIERLLRTLDPAPGAHTSWDGEPLKIWAGTPGARDCGAAPGTVLGAGPEGIEVQCAAGSLVVTELQRAGGRRLPAADFLRGRGIEPGQRWGS
jgi:methionyl-tRNA formyltransferase